MRRMLQVLKVAAIVLAVISAGIVVLGLGVAAANWLHGAGDADAAPPPPTAASSVSQAAPAIEASSPCGADATTPATVCEADGTATAPTCDTAVPTASPPVAAATGQVPAIDREAPARTKTATFALG
jgi:hypothetical protein